MYIWGPGAAHKTAAPLCMCIICADKRKSTIYGSNTVDTFVVQPRHPSSNTILAFSAGNNISRFDQF